MTNNNGKRNRSAGNGWERELAELFRAIGFPHVVTTRSESRSRDAQKIDLMNKNEGVVGRLPYNVQAKNTTGHLKYAKVMSEMPVEKGIVNVILHKQTERSGIRFICRDKFAILKMDDFINMVRMLQQLEKSVTSYEAILQKNQELTDLEIEEDDSEYES